MLDMTALELFLMYREYRLNLPHSDLPPCYRDNPQPYEHFLVAWQTVQAAQSLWAERDTPE